MFILGILSIFQMVLLPGLIIANYFPIPLKGIPNIVIVFGISLLINYFLVSILLIMGIYSQLSLIIIIIVEILWLTWRYRFWLTTPIDSLATEITQCYFTAISEVRPLQEGSAFKFVIRGFTLIVLFVFSATDLYWFANKFFRNLGSIFLKWDAVVSWNRWATELSQGQFPNSTSYYPQLIPANWSLTYVLGNSPSLQFFPKSIMPLFPILMFLIILDLAYRERSIGMLIGAVFFRFLVKRFLEPYITDGYMDLPVAFFAMAGIYTLILGARKQYSETITRNFLILSGLLLAASTLTKQAGLFTLLLFPILGIGMYSSKDELRTRWLMKAIIAVFLLALSISASWYIVKYFDIATGNDASNVYTVTVSIFKGAGLLQRAQDAWILLGKYGPLLITAIFASIFITKPFGWICLIVILPFSIIWALFFSYSTRNLSLILPFWAICIGFFADAVFAFILQISERTRIQRIPIIIFPLLVFTTMLIGNFINPSEKILARHSDAQWNLFSPELNDVLREIILKDGNETKILARYPIEFLPGLSDIRVTCLYNDYDSFIDLLTNRDLDYLLVPTPVIDEINKKIEQMEAFGYISLVTTTGSPFPHRLFIINDSFAP